jgi:MFS family permease
VADSGRSATFGEVFGVREFLGIWLATVLSVAGDQFARVALSLLVFDRTRSALLAALTYAVTFIPDLVGGSLLAGLADRLPRRQVMIGTDVARAGLVALMAVPGTPIVLLLVLLFAVQLLAVPFTAARSALLPTILRGDRFEVGTGILTTTYQVGLVVGYPLGAVVVTWLGTRGALLADAATFVVSAMLIVSFVADRGAVESPGGRPRTTWRSLTGGARLVRSDPKLRALLALACVSGFYIAPEGLVVPYSDQIGAGTLGVGVLLAANPLGTAVGMVVLSRFVAPERRVRWLGPMAVATSLALLPSALAPGLAASFGLWALAGLFSAHDMVTNTQYVRAVPEHARGQAIGLAIAGLRGAQGLGVVVAGVLAEFVTPARVIGALAVLGVLAAWLAARAWRRAALPPPPQT